MRNEALALEIVQAVVAVYEPRGVPVTLKMRTGWSLEERNALRLARAFEAAGIAMLTIHGRTREQGYKGLAEYDTIAAVKAAIKIPVVANGDIDSPEKPAPCWPTPAPMPDDRPRRPGPALDLREVAHFLATGEYLPAPTVGRCATFSPNTCTTTTASMASKAACAAPASTSVAVRGCRGRGLPPAHEHLGALRPAVTGAPRLV